MPGTQCIALQPEMPWIDKKAPRKVRGIKLLWTQDGPILMWRQIPFIYLRLGSYSGEGNGTLLQYSCLENPWTEEPGRLQSMGLLGIAHD